MTTAKGGRLATSIGGSLTGRGGELIIIDDPIKPVDATSANLRQKVIDWSDNTLLSRLNDKKKGTIILVMQRLQLRLHTGASRRWRGRRFGLSGGSAGESDQGQSEEQAVHDASLPFKTWPK